MINMEKPSLEELAHYGVKGMRWGHHKRPDTVEIATARAIQEKEKVKLKKAQKLYKKQTAYGLLGATEKEQKALALATREYNYTKEDLGKAKILNKLKLKPKSEEQLKLEAKYKKDKKMTDDEAAVAAYQHIRTKKILMVVGGLTVAAAVAYTGYKLHDARVDKIIKSGTLLQNISTDSSRGVRDAFYSSANKVDDMKYRGLYGKHLGMLGADVYKKDIKILSDIKQASPRNAHRILEDLIRSDPEFETDLKDYLKKGNRLGGIVYGVKTGQANTALASGKVTKNVYEIFNANLVNHEPDMQSLTDRYFKALASKGYNAIRDVNDSKYSGYNSVNPIIAFNAHGKLDVVNVEKLARDAMTKDEQRSYASIIGSTVVKKGSGMAAGYLAGDFGLKKLKVNIDQKTIDKYRQENPNTTMTNTEIIRMIERSKR